MNILAICSALNNSYIALEINGIVIKKTIKSDENYHSLYLIKDIKKIFEQNNYKFEDLDALGVNLGPGSFTGIRVALTIAKVMAGELNLPLIGLNTSEILLNTYNAQILLMDARRDMYYLGDENGIELIYKDKIPSSINTKKVVCDKRSKDMVQNAVCFEEVEGDIAQTMLELAKSKYKNSPNKEEFNYLKVCPNYIQTPPVFA